MAVAGGDLISVLDDIRTNSPSLPVSLRQLAGRPVDHVIDAIVAALVPENGDADRIREALNEALSESLEGLSIFDPSILSAELITEVFLRYVERCIFEEIVLQSKDAFSKADSSRVERAEKDLLALVIETTEDRMRPMIANGLSLTKNQLRDLQVDAIREVLLYWEGWDHD